eukprot:m.474136 g.474136  ORF g.474136 m.474136 type:complete len:76 (-) comp35770_c0_seq1:147-374(-)
MRRAEQGGWHRCPYANLNSKHGEVIHHLPPSLGERGLKDDIQRDNGDSEFKAGTMGHSSTVMPAADLSGGGTVAG